MRTPLSGTCQVDGLRSVAFDIGVCQSLCFGVVRVCVCLARFRILHADWQLCVFVTATVLILSILFTFG